MVRTIIKGIISLIIGAVIFFFLFFISETKDFFDMAIWGTVSSVLGYVFLSSLLMSDKESKDFEKKIDDTLFKK
ncbi:hypothetical protein [Pseudalkalibacillus caeni]|uniref:Uncharacterized protein n=1 Tax=Exobacillus caeni TaxID=2574798 RepID=A0A5R9F6B4_9BACL|nr:hypothetical protein [Pseudalkalibacillus caeni]TLS37168.1 hypothetical protein FCL54_11615 [Pseudalkalibacillus caeni]